MAKVVLCIGGGISAYKTPDLVRGLIAVGHQVQVCMTEAARTFVSELSLTTVSQREVRCSLFDAASEGRIGHIDIADWADIVVVAPATADLMARASQGLANDLVATVLLATKAPIVWAPAMNSNMWSHPATRNNLKQLAERGGKFAGPVKGQLACGWIGEGKMMDPAAIVDVVAAQLSSKSPTAHRWKGKRMLVSTGPTRTFIDPVRFISNASTGEMGLAMARAAQDAGAEVVVVAGPSVSPSPEFLHRIDVQTGEEMLAALRRQLKTHLFDCVAMVAAVSDLRNDTPSPVKIEKDHLLVQLGQSQWTSEHDLLSTLCNEFRGISSTRFLGFAAQTVEDPARAESKQSLIDSGQRKMTKKGCHAIFVNPVGIPGYGFGSETNAGYLLFEGSNASGVSCERPVPKYELAEWILEHCRKQWFAIDKA